MLPVKIHTPSMVALEWTNGTYAAIDMKQPPTESWWATLVAVLTAPWFDCYQSGWCYGHDNNWFSNETGIYWVGNGTSG